MPVLHSQIFPKKKDGCHKKWGAERHPIHVINLLNLKHHEELFCRFFKVIDGRDLCSSQNGAVDPDFIQ